MMEKKIFKLDTSIFYNHKDEIFECLLQLKNGSEEESISILNSMEKFLKDYTAIIFTVQIDDKIVGLIWSYKISDTAAHINYFVVLDTYRNHGLGSTLFDKMKDYLLLKGIKRIELLVNKQNSNAINFYLKKDFCIIDYDENKQKMIFEEV